MFKIEEEMLATCERSKSKKFCQTVRRKKLKRNFWRNSVYNSLYLDGKGFEYKTNPNDQARSLSARILRKRGEGLKFKCTAKGKKKGGIFVNFMIGEAYGKREVDGHNNAGEKFACCNHKALF